MKNTLVLYYSRTGNNRFVAERLAGELGCDIAEIRPALGGFFFLLLGSALKAGLGNRRLSRDPGSYERIVLCGPIWMGQVVWPIRSLLRRYRRSIRSLAFVTACGSDDSNKDTGFGFESVFAKYREILGQSFAGGYALPVNLAAGAGAGAEATKTRLTEAAFSGDILTRYEATVAALRDLWGGE